MRAFVAMRNYITTTTQITAELSEIRAKLALLERADEDNAEAVNDLSEDMRKELDNIYQAIAALSIKVPQARKVGQPIGFEATKRTETANGNAKQSTITFHVYIYTCTCILKTCQLSA